MQISGHPSDAFSRKMPGTPKFELLHCVKKPPILIKSTDRDENLNRWSGYISIPNFRPLPPGVLQKMSENPRVDPLH